VVCPECPSSALASEWRHKALRRRHRLLYGVVVILQGLATVTRPVVEVPKGTDPYPCPGSGYKRWNGYYKAVPTLIAAPWRVVELPKGTDPYPCAGVFLYSCLFFG
jgi:hypothetical protein